MENNKQTLIERILNQKLQGTRLGISGGGRPTSADTCKDGCSLFPDDCGCRIVNICHQCDVQECGGPEKCVS